jgi:protein TonB
MPKPFKKPKEKNNNYSGLLIGIAFSFLLFLAIPLTQIFTNYEKAPESIDSLEIAPPPPPPPPEDPPPPEPEEEEPPPELDTPPPPISLEQLDMALEPGTGGSLSGDFALPSFDAKKTDLGMDIFNINDLDKIPGFRRPPNISYPVKAQRLGLSGYVVIRFIVDEQGNVGSIEIVEASDKIFVAPVRDAYLKAKFNPGEKNGRTVKFKMQQKIPFTN